MVVFIEKGAPDGHTLTYRNAADEFLNVRSGNINVKVEEIAHPVFKREGVNLKLHMEITLREALLGFEKKIIHLDGHIVEVNRKSQTTKPGLINRFKGEGMPIFEQYGDYGDLLVTFVVKFPESLTE